MTCVCCVSVRGARVHGSNSSGRRRNEEEAVKGRQREKYGRLCCYVWWESAWSLDQHAPAECLPGSTTKAHDAPVVPLPLLLFVSNSFAHCGAHPTHPVGRQQRCRGRACSLDDPLAGGGLVVACRERGGVVKSQIIVRPGAPPHAAPTGQQAALLLMPGIPPARGRRVQGRTSLAGCPHRCL